MLPYLFDNTDFPSTDLALDEPNGLLAAGGELSVKRLIQAYSKGIFPWYSSDEPILWWSPDPRAVFVINEFKTHKSVIKTLKQLDLKVTLNHNFEQVIKHCSKPRINDDETEGGTWILPEMMKAYIKLHQQGFAHSVEVWLHGELVGGIYGVVSGGVFCGESMFSEISNGSKVALSCLVKYLKQFDFRLLDCQMENSHLNLLGAINISRKNYLLELNKTENLKVDSTIWSPQVLSWQQLLIGSKS